MKQKVKNVVLKNLQTLKYIGFEYTDIKFDNYDDTQYDLPASLDTLENIVTNCSLCNFSQNNKNILFGEGKKDSNIVFLNLYSSSLQSENKNIFTGNSAKMLSKICLNVLGIPIDDVYIVNILKCIPSKNIEDCATEINTCRPYIQKQLDIINPKLIVAFGDSYNYLANCNKSLVQLRQETQEYNGIKVISTFHPTYILRNPSCKKDVFEDLQKAKSIMELL
ncbi:MAG: uracil-DNA glycosylase [Arcobacteraceae bacterium]|nr:uracil-DNA glycosylase [Arcobacteraceae bacterium]